MAENQPNKKLIRNIVIVVALLLVAVGSGFAARWLQVSVNNQPPPLDDSSFFPAAVQESRSLVAQGKHDEANAKLQDAIQSSSNNDEKLEYYLELAVNYQNQDQYQKAIDIYKQALTIKETSGLYQGMGGAAELMGNKQLAIDSYNKAIELLDTTSPLYKAEKARIQGYIKSLEEG